MNPENFTIVDPAAAEMAAMEPQREKEEASIVCGTDFSQNSAMAVEVAAAFAKRLGEPVMLVHAGHGMEQPMLPENLRESLCFYERSQLYQEHESAQHLGVNAVEVFENGPPEQVIRNAAATHHGRLIVISSHRARRGRSWGLGSVAEKIAETSPVPTLVVRNAAPFSEWLSGKRALRIFAAADLSESSVIALRWLRWLRTLAPCDVTVSMFYSEPIMVGIDMAPTPGMERMRLAAERMQERSFRQKVRNLLGPEPVRVRIEQGWERSDIHLIHCAEAVKADLIVVGARQLHGLSRLMSHSFSRGVLHYAKTSVACVPCMNSQ